MRVTACTAFRTHSCIARDYRAAKFHLGSTATRKQRAFTRISVFSPKACACGKLELATPDSSSRLSNLSIDQASNLSIFLSSTLTVFPTTHSSSSVVPQ